MRAKAKNFLMIIISVTLLSICLSFSVSAKATVGTVSKLRYTATENSVTLTWNKAKKAKGYKVMEKKNGEWKTMAVTTSTACILTDLSVGSKHTYAVKAFTKSGDSIIWAKKSKKITAVTNPRKVKTLKATVKDNTVTLKWKKTKGATGYKIYQYNSIVEKWVNIKNTKNLKVTLNNLEQGEEYIFAVKAYCKKGKKTALSSSYTKATVTIHKPVVSEPVNLHVNSYGQGDGIIYVEVDSSNWNGKCVTNTQYITAKVNGVTLDNTVTCKVNSNYEIRIDISSLNLHSGSVVAFTIPTGIIKNAEGTQYNMSFSASVIV